MMDGFDLNSPLVCEGIIGDGCGGGRIFYIQGEKLLVYDAMTQKSMVLLEGVDDAYSLKKEACIITIELRERVVTLDLSTLE